MTWTSDLPISPGWYWWRAATRNKAVVKRVFFGASRKLVMEVGLSAEEIKRVGGQWAGPLWQPSEEGE